MSNDKLTDLMKQQEAKRKELAAGVYEAWKPVKETETELLASYGGNYQDAPENVQDEVDNNRIAFFKEWGNDGKLTAILDDAQIREREKLIQHQQKVEELQNRHRRDDNNNGNGR